MARGSDKEGLIAVDIDDVLALTTDALCHVVNKTYKLELTTDHYRIPGEYWGYYEHVWRSNGLEGVVEYDIVQRGLSEDQSHVMVQPGAVEKILELTERHDVAVITSRNIDQEEATLRWLDEHFSDVFSSVNFCGHGNARQQTKGELCRRLGAKWLIDDNVDYCRSALENGCQPILYGEYGWHQDVPDGLIRISNWQQIGEFFDGQ